MTEVIYHDNKTNTVVSYPNTSMVMVAMSPDCTAPFKLQTVDITSGNTIESCWFLYFVNIFSYLYSKALFIYQTKYFYIAAAINLFIVIDS